MPSVHGSEVVNRTCFRQSISSPRRRMILASPYLNNFFSVLHKSHGNLLKEGLLTSSRVSILQHNTHSQETDDHPNIWASPTSGVPDVFHFRHASWESQRVQTQYEIAQTWHLFNQHFVYLNSQMNHLHESPKPQDTSKIQTSTYRTPKEAPPEVLPKP